MNMDYVPEYNYPHFPTIFFGTVKVSDALSRKNCWSFFSQERHVTLFKFFVKDVGRFKIRKQLG